jgi:uncharacterized damage-inducible protein DinB
MARMDRPLVLASLAATPRMLREMARDCSAAQATAAPKPGEWAITDVVRHLVEGDRDTFLPRVRRMLAEPRPVFAPRRPAEGDRADLGTLLDVFARVRADAVAILGALDDTGWAREGVSPSRGSLTVATYAASMVAHDTEHLRQIQDVRSALGLVPKRCEARQALPAAELTAALSAAARRVADVGAGLDAAALRRRPEPTEWCLTEIMAHLADLERALFLPRLRRIVDEHRPAFEPFDPETWARSRDHRARDFAVELEVFTDARRQTVSFLARLAPGATERLAVSGHFGPVTLAQYATHVVDHDLEHLAQMRACRAALSRG